MNKDHAVLRSQLAETLKLLGASGKQADALLLEEEETRALSTTPEQRADEQRLQTLSALSRQIWTAHGEIQRAIAAVDKLTAIDGRHEQAREQ